MAHIVCDGVVRITDAINSKQFSRSSIKNAVRALRAKRQEGKPGRSQAIIGEKEETVLDVIRIDSICGSSLTMKKTRKLMENVLNDTKIEDEAHSKVSKAAEYGFLKRHPELRKSKPKSLDINRLAVSSISVLKPWVIHPSNQSTWYCKEAQRMDNATLVAAVAADGYSLPGVILWPAVHLPDEPKPLLSPTLGIWPNKSG